jgi:uncharacterized protein (TIGR02588 family)
MAKRTREDQIDAIPGWSWTAAAFGLVLVIGSVGFMLFKAFTGDASPPRIAIEVDAITRHEQGYLVQMIVMNHGGLAAADLVVEGVLRTDAENEETSTITLGYVPSGSHRRAGLFFSQDPQKFDLQVRAKGYELP